MRGTNRTIARRLLVRGTLLGALLVIALSVSTATANGPPRVRGGKSFVLPWQTSSHSVAVSPAGIAWFGTTATGSLSLVSVQAGVGMKVENLDPTGELVKGNDDGTTESLHFDGEGNLWFVRRDSAGEDLVIRAPEGAETVLDPPGVQAVGAFTIGPEGDAWLPRGNRGSPTIARMTPAGTATTFPLPPGNYPTSLVAGPDGNIWFAEEDAGRIGRITPGGEVRIFALGRKVHPREIVAGPGGALWFSENGRSRPHGKSSDRIGRLTTAGKVTQFPIPFGRGTERLAADPRGRVWFSTEKNEISSISSAGTVGARGCPGSCASAIYSLALAPDGGLWFAAEKHYVPCLECGGGTAILQQLEGAPVGEIPAGALGRG